MQYGEKIRELREKFGLSQSELAQKLGVHKQMISDVERGKQKRFNPQIEKRLVELFDLPQEWFVQEQSVADESKSPEEEILLKYFRQIPAQNRLQALACILQCLSEHSKT